MQELVKDKNALIRPPATGPYLWVRSKKNRETNNSSLLRQQDFNT